MYFRENGQIVENYNSAQETPVDSSVSQKNGGCNVPLWLVFLLVVAAVAGGWWLWKENRKSKKTESFKAPSQFGFKFY